MRTKDFLQLFAWEVINPIVLRLKRKKGYRLNSSFAGINLGCGTSNPSNWIGIDGGVFLLFRKMPKFITKRVWKYFNMSDIHTFESYISFLDTTNVIHYDLQYGIPFDDETVPAIYSSHFFEHLFRKDAVILLKECYRVLQPGVVIRICVPSVEDEINKMKTAIIAYEKGDLEKIQPYVTLERVGFINKYSNHKFMYNFAEIQKILAQVGFANISEKQRGIGNISNVQELDTRDGIFVEAMKPLNEVK
jgi:SAM-dependent methyltransferase